MVIGKTDEIIDPSMEGMPPSMNKASDTKFDDSDEYSGASSEVIETEPDGTEVWSPKFITEGNRNSMINGKFTMTIFHTTKQKILMIT